jgi:hypothetical protein
MVIIDLQQVMISNLMQQLGAHQNATLDENLLRHMILNKIRSLRVKYSEGEWGEMVIACDSSSWRKTVFPYYKAARKKNRDASELDWNSIFNSFSKVRSELETFFPYRVIEIEGAEADDIIGVLAHNFGVLLGSGQEKIMIVSGDKDFKQLQKYSNVSQYDPVRKKTLRCDDADLFLKEHIIRGDSSDGIPNILAKDDVFVTGTRQPVLSQKRMLRLMSLEPEEMTTEEQRNWNRNKILIDLNSIPEALKTKILERFESQANKSRSNLFNYFIKFKLKHLMEHISEF